MTETKFCIQCGRKLPVTQFFTSTRILKSNGEFRKYYTKKCIRCTTGGLTHCIDCGEPLQKHCVKRCKTCAKTWKSSYIAQYRHNHKDAISKQKYCSIIKKHHEEMQHDPEHLTTDFIKKLLKVDCKDTNNDKTSENLVGSHETTE